MEEAESISSPENPIFPIYPIRNIFSNGFPKKEKETAMTDAFEENPPEINVQEIRDFNYGNSGRDHAEEVKFDNVIEDDEDSAKEDDEDSAKEIRVEDSSASQLLQGTRGNIYKT